MIHPLKNLLEEINIYGDVYTEFKPDAYLTHVQLNQITQYFEDSIRLRSSKELGVGKIGGFQVIKDKTTAGADYIRLTPGVGVTTDSGLIFTDKMKEFTYCREFNNKMKYPRLMTDVKDYIFEMRTEEDFTSSPGEQRLPLPSSLNDYHVVAFLDCFKVDKELCDVISCDDSGDQVNMELKFLLVHDSHWNDVLMPDDTIYHEHNVFEFHQNLPDISVKRAVLLPTNANTTLEVYTIFKDKIDRWQDLRDAIISIVDRFDSRLDFISAGFSKSAIENAFNNTFQNLNSKSDIQYLYDHYKNLVETYNQIKSLILFLNVDCNPSYKAFPNHLCITYLKKVNQVSKCHQFYYSPLLKDKKENLRKFKSLIIRLWNQLNTYNCPTNQEIRLTSSKDYPFEINKRAIPYYYKFSSLKSVWDWESTLEGTENIIHSYHNRNDNVQLDIDHLDKEIYMVEGILNQNFSTALKKINDIKRNKGLAFDVKTVSIGKGNANINWDDFECDFADLRTMLKSWELDYRCLIKGFEKYFGGIQMYDLISAVSNRPSTEPVSYARSNVSATSLDNSAHTVAEAFKTEAKTNMSRCQINDAISNKYVPNDSPQLKASAIFKSTILIYGYIRKLYDPTRSWTDFLKNGSYLNTVVQNIDSFCADRQQMYDIMVQYARELTETNQGIENNLLFYDLFATYSRLTDVCCYSSKLGWMKSEIAERKRTILEKLTLSNIAKNCPGAEHKRAVGKGETLLLVYNGEIDGNSEFGLNNNNIVADFTLPYMCCSDCSPTQIIHIPEGPSETDVYAISNTETEICDKDNFRVLTTKNGASENMIGTMTISEIEFSDEYTSGTEINFVEILKDKDVNDVIVNFSFPNDLNYAVTVYKAYQPEIEAFYDPDKKGFKVNVINYRSDVGLRYVLNNSEDFTQIINSNFFIESDKDLKLTVKTEKENTCFGSTYLDLSVPIVENVYAVDGPKAEVCESDPLKIITTKNGQEEKLEGKIEIQGLEHSIDYTSNSEINVQSLIRNVRTDENSVTLNFSFPHDLTYQVEVYRTIKPEISYTYDRDKKSFIVDIVNKSAQLEFEYSLNDQGSYSLIQSLPLVIEANRNQQIKIRIKGDYPCQQVAIKTLEIPGDDILNDVKTELGSIKDSIANNDSNIEAFSSSRKRISSIKMEELESEEYKNNFASGKSLMTLYKSSSRLSENNLKQNSIFFNAELMTYFQFIRLLNDEDYIKYTLKNEMRVYKETTKFKSYLNPSIISRLSDYSFNSNKGKKLTDEYIKLTNNL